MDEKQRLAHCKRIDEQWADLKPKWGKSHNRGERRMLYDLLEESEGLHQLIGGMFGPELSHARSTGNTLHAGVIVATDRRIMMVDKGLLWHTEVAEMPYSSIEAITHSTGLMFAGLQITGRGIASFRIEHVSPKSDAREFADFVHKQLEALREAPVTVAPSLTQELEKLADLHERGLLTPEEFQEMKQKLL